VFRRGELGAAGRAEAGAEAGGNEEAQAVENLTNVQSFLVVQRPTYYLTVFGTSSCTNYKIPYRCDRYMSCSNLMMLTIA
jgi:hypothetical protein